MRHISLHSLVNRRQHRKKAGIQNLQRRAVRVGFGCVSVGLLAVVFGMLAGSLAYAGLVKDLPSLAVLPDLLNPENGLLRQPTRIYDRSGQKLLLSLENPGISRKYLYLDSIKPDHFSPELIRVAVGYLDPGYWNSPGIIYNRLFDPSPSTVAERLVDDLLLEQEPRSLRRTLRMKLLSAQIISRFGHVQVLEWYLNNANFGHLAFGAESAARLYLDVPAANLDLSQAALLVAALRAPALNPIDARDVALAAQKNVLKQIQARGVINQEEYLRALVVEPHIAQEPAQTRSPAKAFSAMVLDSLQPAFSLERLERGGIKVITTLDYDLQMELSCLVQTQISRITGLADSQQEEIRLFDGNACQSVRLLPTLSLDERRLDAVLLSNAAILDPLSGQVLALLGDTTTQGEVGPLSYREPGSMLTPFAAVASFARGFGPASLVWDIPSSLPEDLASKPNPDGLFHGPVRMRQALANDYLGPQAMLIQQVGAANVWRLAGAMGLSSLVDEKSSALIYQGGRISALELAQGYGVFAAQGYRSGQKRSTGSDLTPALVLYVEDARGTSLLDLHVQDTQAVASPQLSYLVHHILSDSTARRASLGSPNPLEIGRPSGAKIGYVEGSQQIWAAGYTPQRVAVFWLGFSDKDTRQVSAKMVAGMWHAVMQYANRNLPVKDWPEPAGITTLDVCNPSGLLPTEACPETAREIFISGSEPTSPDDLYQKVQINRETGRLATVFTPAYLVEEKVYMILPPAAESWAKAAGLPVPPRDYDAIQPPEPSAVVRITRPHMYAFLKGEIIVKGTAAGDGFQFYQLLVGQGLNPQTWLQIGNDGVSPVTNDILGVWNTKELEGLYTIRLLVARRDQTLEIATIQVTIDNTIPQVRIPYPLAGQEISVSSGGTITLQAEVSDSFGVNRVAWLVDGKIVGESSQNPYIYPWTARQGDHTLEIKAYDQAGNEATSELIRFRVMVK